MGLPKYKVVADRFAIPVLLREEGTAAASQGVVEALGFDRERRRLLRAELAHQALGNLT